MGYLYLFTVKLYPYFCIRYSVYSVHLTYLSAAEAARCSLTSESLIIVAADHVVMT